MTKDFVIDMISENLRLIRVEVGYTQDKMANVIGLSKKTLVQIEKGRVRASWTIVIAVCALFRDSSIVVTLLGGAPLETVETIAREDISIRKEKTLGGRVWWREVQREKEYILQQNIISQHFRIIDGESFRLHSSFDEESILIHFQELTQKSN
ncbi:helix-turn-helix transcriptional regulator [Bacillus sp. 2205SS5-2]|uniref:helix-turn-helix transcriptional regulator n=1 Tax=Bacillus sp. 2205SS5-2 TaxID=3109031 RepID=UPI003004A5D0